MWWDFTNSLKIEDIVSKGIKRLKENVLDKKGIIVYLVRLRFFIFLLRKLPYKIK